MAEKSSAKRARKPDTTQQSTTAQRGRKVWRKTFIRVLSIQGNVTAASSAAGIERSTAYDLRKADPTFAKEWADALEQAGDTLEAAAWKRGVKGVKRVVHSAGKVVGYEIEYSDSLLQTLLKANKPDKYRERIQLDSSPELKELLPLMVQWVEILKTINIKPRDAMQAIIDEYAAAKQAQELSSIPISSDYREQSDGRNSA